MQEEIKFNLACIKNEKNLESKTNFDRTTEIKKYERRIEIIKKELNKRRKK